MNAHGNQPAMPLFNLPTAGRDGLTKRELFAAMAMQSLAGSYADGGNFHENHVAKGAVLLADALLSALKETQP